VPAGGADSCLSIRVGRPLFFAAFFKSTYSASLGE